MHNLPLEEVGFSDTRGNVARYVFNSTYVGEMTLLQIEKTFVVKLQLMGELLPRMDAAQGTRDNGAM